MKTCPKCGAQVADDAAFCNICGAPLGSAPAAAQDTPAAQPQTAPEQAQQAAPAQAPVQPQYQQPQFQQPVYQQPIPVAPAVDVHDHTAEFDAQDIAENKLLAVGAYLFSILGVILAYVSGSKFAKFHAYNSMRLSIALLICWIPAIIPVIGWIFSGIVSAVLCVVEIICIVHAFQGKAKDCPIVSGIGFLK